jgi:hypothetical protein
MKKTFALAVLVAATACGSSDTKPTTPIAPVTSADGTCPLAHANGGTVDVPWGDAAKMRELQGRDGKSTAKVTIEWPAEGQVIDAGTGAIKYTLAGYSIGKAGEGDFQHCHVILDDKPYFADYDHSTTLEALNGGKPVAEGSHWLTIFPARNFHLSVKNEGACAQVRFHVKKKMGEVPGPKDPQLIYSRPKGAYDSKHKENEAIMLDFYLLNVKLGKGDHTVHATATHEGKEVAKLEIDEWWPQIILKDAKPGDYEVTLELHDKDGKLVPGAFNKTTRKITVK